MAVTGSRVRSIGSATHRGIDKFDLVMLLLLLATFAGVALLPFSAMKFGDLVFHREAKDLALAIRGAGPWNEAQFSRAPAPVVYYAIPYLAVSPGSDDNAYWRAAFIWTMVWLSYALILIRRCGEFLGGPAAGKTAALLTLLAPFSVYYSYGILAETPAYIGAVLFTYAYLRWTSSPRELSKSWVEIVVFAVGLLMFVLSRPNSVLLLLFAVLAGVSWMRSGNADQKLKGRFVLTVVLATAAMIALITLLLFRRSGGVGANSQNQNFSQVALQGRFQFRSVIWDFRTWPDVPDNPDFIEFERKRNEFRSNSSQTGIPVSKLRWEWIIGDFLHHPGITLQSGAIKLLALHLAFVHSLEPEKFHFGFLHGRWGYALFHLAVNAFTILLVVGSLLFVVSQRHTLLNHWVLWGPWLALTVFHVVTYAEARYLFPSRPGLVLMASAALVPRVQALFAHYIEPKDVVEPIGAG